MSTLRVARLAGTPLYSLSGFYSPALNEESKRVPGMRFDWDRKVWCGYIDAVELTVAALRARPFSVPVDDSAITDPPATLTPFQVAAEGLWGYQKEDVKWVLGHASEGCILGSEPGTGKSAIAIRFARATKMKTLVVCPNNVRGVWAGSGFLSRTADRAPHDGEVWKWWREAAAHLFICSTTKPTEEQLSQLAVSQVAICHYDILHAWAEPLLAAGVRVAIFDEAHLRLCGAIDMKTGVLKSRTGAAAALISASVPYRVALTGTPLTNRPKDLFGLVNTVSPGRFGDRPFGYYLKHCAAKQVEVGKNIETRKVVWDYSGSSNEEELKRRTSRIILRRTKAEVSKDLPDMTRTTIDLEVATRFRSDPSSVIIGSKIDERVLRRQLAAAADGKVPQIAEAVLGFVQEASKVVVFTYRRAVAEEIAAALQLEGIDATFSHGGLPQKERERRISSKPDVLACTIDTTAVGISLAWADVAVFAELTYEPHELLQAESRLHRPGQHRNVRVIYYIAAGTTDELVRSAVLSKLDTFSAVVGGGGINAALKSDLDPHAGESYEESMSRLYAAIQKQAAPAAVTPRARGRAKVG